MKQTPSLQPLPVHIALYAFDFRWSNELLWQLEVPTEKMNVDELIWHFDIPWLHTPNGRFDLKPTDVMTHQNHHPEEYARTMQSDTSYPIDIMFNKGRWLILDGLHRLMKSVDAGKQTVTVRKIPRELVPKIEK